MQNNFSKHLICFRKNHRTKNYLFVLIDIWRAIVNKKITLMNLNLNMGLSKSFDTLDHSLLLVKLIANGFDNKSLSFVYLTNRFQ